MTEKLLITEFSRTTEELTKEFNQVNEPDFFIFSDGSGNDSKPEYPKSIGYFSLVLCSATQRMYPAGGTELVRTKSSIYRAEFLGLLSGLKTLHNIEVKPGFPYVVWICDNSSLVSAVNNEASRKAEPDLWKIYSSIYEANTGLQGIHIKRDSNNVHNYCDKHASLLRKELEDYRTCEIL